MTSKTISITAEVYNRLVKLKDEKESFSQLFQRMLEVYNQNLKDCYGAWKISDEDYSIIWEDITHRRGRKWQHNQNMETNS
ncbi:MAG: antitoxin VapB family protein [Promethearchaeota archaeon]